MKRIYSNERPELVETGRAINPVTYTTVINFSVREEQDPVNGRFSFHRVELYPSQLNYGGIVSAIIKEAYTDDEMQAIINNYLAPGATQSSIDEFIEMQEFRNTAKRIAKEVLGI